VAILKKYLAQGSKVTKHDIVSIVDGMAAADKFVSLLILLCGGQFHVSACMKAEVAMNLYLYNLLKWAYTVTATNHDGHSNENVKN